MDGSSVDPDAERRVKKFFITFATFAAIISPFLLGYSFCVVDPGHVGVLWNKNTNDVTYDTVYGEGRHYCGLGRRLINFPTFAQNVVHTTHTRTKDGLAVDIVSSFQYRLATDSASLKDIYTTFGKKYEPAYSVMVEAALRDVVSQYEAKDLVEDRDNFASGVEVASNDVVKPYFAEVISVQLLNVDWSSRVDDAIMETVVALEDVNTATAERQVALVSSQTEVGQARVLAKNVVAKALQDAALKVAAKEAEAAIIEAQGKHQSNAYKTIKDMFSMTSEQLLQYAYLENLVGGDFKHNRMEVAVPALVQAGLDSL